MTTTYTVSKENSDAKKWRESISTLCGEVPKPLNKSKTARGGSLGAINYLLPTKN